MPCATEHVFSGTFCCDGKLIAPTCRKIENTTRARVTRLLLKQEVQMFMVGQRCCRAQYSITSAQQMCQRFSRDEVEFAACCLTRICFFHQRLEVQYFISHLVHRSRFEELLPDGKREPKSQKSFYERNKRRGSAREKLLNSSPLILK